MEALNPACEYKPFVVRRFDIGYLILPTSESVQANMGSLAPPVTLEQYRGSYGLIVEYPESKRKITVIKAVCDMLLNSIFFRPQKSQNICAFRL